MSKHYTDEEVRAAEIAIGIHGLDRSCVLCGARQRACPKHAARTALDAVARRIVCNGAADALEGALHLVDDDDSAETLARLADQWRIEASHD